MQTCIMTHGAQHGSQQIAGPSLSQKSIPKSFSTGSGSASRHSSHTCRSCSVPASPLQASSRFFSARRQHDWKGRIVVSEEALGETIQAIGLLVTSDQQHRLKRRDIALGQRLRCSPSRTPETGLEAGQSNFESLS